jgi:hypothetical protein
MAEGNVSHGQKRWRRFWAGFTLLWLAGALYAPTAVASIARLKPAGRWIASLLMGGFAFLWGGLKGLGLIEETAQEPNLFWAALAFILPGACFGFIYLMDQPPNPLFNMQKMLAKFARSQGRLQAEEVAQTLVIRRGVPYATVEADKSRTERRRSKEVKVGLDFASGEGHVLVSGPTRSGKVRRVTAQ